MSRVERIRARLDAHGQAHVLAFWDELDETRRARLLDQVESMDLDELDGLVERYVKSAPPAPEVGTPEPVESYGLDGLRGGEAWDAAEYRERGERIIADGKLAAFTVAGGQGTRLGWNGPKGTYPATVVTGKPLFRCFAEQILAARRKYGVTIPWYIMTSPLNDAATRAFFTDNNCFGLPRSNIFMFPQGVMPSLDRETGRLLLADRGTIAMNPDGHGGAIRALRASGAIEEMGGRGIEHISYFQVDNPLVKVVDPVFAGLHAAAPDSSGEMSSKMVAKSDPEEKVGVFARAGAGDHAGRTIVIEYSDLDEEAAQLRRDASGRLVFDAGNVAIHMISVDFVRRLTEGGRLALPLHRAEKQVPHVDPGTGERVEPETPNAVKLETFVFDALPLASASIVLETDRVEEFAPIKNASGTDSPETSHRLQTSRNARWLERRSVEVPRDEQGSVDARIEISPLTALEPDDLGAVELPERIERGAEVVL